MKINDLLKEIERVMISYQNELKNLKNSFTNEESSIKNTIANITKKGIDEEISKEYLKMADIFSQIMSDLNDILKEFSFTDFASSSKKQIASLKPRTALNRKNDTEDWAKTLQEEAIQVMESLENCSDFAKMSELLKQFYQSYVDAMYMKENIISLLKESKVYERKMNSIIQTHENHLEEEKTKYKNDSKLENLQIYPQMQKLKGELKDIRSHEKELRLHNGDIEFGNGYNVSFLMGLHQNAPQKKEVIDFSKKFLDDDLHGFNEEKLYWELDKKQGAMIIDLPGNVMSDRSASKFFEYFEQLLFTLFSEIPIRKLQIASIDCPAPNNQSLSSPFVPILQRAEKYLGSNIMYMPIVRDKSKVTELIDALFLEGQKRSDTYFSEGYENIYNYNASILDNQHDFKFLIINNYPFGFNDRETVAKLQSIIKNKETGIVPIIFQVNEKKVYEIKSSYSNETDYVYLNPKDLGANHLTNFDFEKKTFLYNHLTASFDLTVSGFNNLKYWEDIQRGYQSANSLYLDAFLNQVEKMSDRKKYSIYDYKLRIPLGKVNGDIYDFTINVKDDSSAIILGTTGSGKSSLMHTLILSAARMYAPNELKICLVDFKGVDASTEFSLYKKGEDLYLPHINYLSLKSTTENALDMLDMLESLQNDRMKLIAKNKVANIVEYNNLSHIKNTDKIIPRILFIIDEFNTMLAGGAAKTDDDSSINDVIEARIFSLLTRVRSSGITIIFSGHTTAGLNDRHMSQIKIRVGLNGFVGRLFEEKYNEPEIDTKILNEKGKSFISNDLGKSKSVVSLAFSGETGSKRQISIVESIRQKFAHLGNNFEQVVAGSTDIMPISEMKNLQDIILEEAKIDEDSYSAYIGVTSTSSLPVAMRFSSEQSALNYFMIGESNRLTTYERNVILGFVYTLKVRHLLKNKESISYVRIESGIRDKNNELKDYLKYQLVNQCVSMVENEHDACAEILKVYEMYQNRLKKSNKDTSPYLLVIHNVGWLKETSWLNDNETIKEEDEDRFSLDIENMSSDDLLSALNIGNLLNDSSDKEISEDNKGKTSELDVIKVSQALTTLYCKGYRQNIFVVLSTPIYSDLYDFLMATERDATAHRFSISDGFNIKNDTNKYPVSCCHVNSTKLVYDEYTNTAGTKFVSSKTRMFDYSINTEGQFLKKLNEEK